MYTYLSLINKLSLVIAIFIGILGNKRQTWYVPEKYICLLAELSNIPIFV